MGQKHLSESAMVSIIDVGPIIHPLDDAILKVKRAKTHINSLNRRIQRFIETNSYSYNIEKHESHGIDHILSFKPSAQPPLEWGLIVGDIVTNLRASLDHIAWQLALLTKANPSRQTQFPIYTTPKGFHDKKRGGRMIKDIPPSAVEIIEAMQPYPYHKTSWPKTELLSMLNELVNADKHRLITQTYTQAEVHLSPQLGPISMRLNSPVDIVITKRIASIMKEKHPPVINPDIVFDLKNSPIEGYSISNLTLMHNFIRYEIIPSFKKFFP